VFTWYVAVLRKYATFGGRAGLPEFWWFSLVNFVISLVLTAFVVVSVKLADVLLVIYALATLLPSLAVGVRRLHDINRSGWFLLISLVPFIGGIWLLVLLALGGDAGPNKYGPPPGAQPIDATVSATPRRERAPSDGKPPTLELHGVSKHFGSVQALTEVDFEVRSGEVMALVGDNGAGKSTLIKCVAGINAIDGGEILFEGNPVQIHGPKDAARFGIEVVYQDLALCDNRDVVQNMYLGREERDVFFRVRDAAMERRTQDTLRSLSVTTLRSVRQPVATLSGGQRQSVAVARAVMWNSRVVILDEPTAALGVAQTRQVLDLVKRLAEQGQAVVIVSHNLHDIFEVADRITVLRLGKNVGVFDRDKTTQQEIVSAITAGIATKVSGIPEAAAPKHEGDGPEEKV
jgi:D-xylose transport system ATP-binding protein